MTIRNTVQAIWAYPCEVTKLNPCQHCVEAALLEVRKAALDAIDKEAEPEPPEPEQTRSLSRVQLVRMFVRATKDGIASRFKAAVAVK
jgi:hypothetical protein